MAIARVTPYIWTTWLSRLLVGEISCEWASWYKSHNQYYEKVPNTFDSVAWKLEHTPLVRKAREILESQGKAVFVENQNRFTLRSKKTGVELEGRPDLIGLAETSTICDAKTGQPKDSDIVQVMIYMYAVPRAIPRYNGMKFDGLVVYNDHTVEIPADAIDSAFIAKLGDLVRRITSLEPTRRVPSITECRYCDISGKHCADRVEYNPEEDEEVGTTEDF